MNLFSADMFMLIYFIQFLLGGFQWRTYIQMNTEAENFGRGLRELGLKPFENVVIFAETRAEWLIAAIGCMKQNMPIVTLYASLGDDALIHGINETDVSCIVTSQQLLEKFKNILPSTANVNLLVLHVNFFLSQIVNFNDTLNISEFS